MKISWFSPVPPDHTDIANYTMRLMPVLVRAFDTEVYSESKTCDDQLKALCPVNHFTAERIDWKALNRGGIPVYHIGNNIHFHAEIIKACRMCPGIVVMHDLSIHETILNLCLKHGYGKVEYFSILNRFGGKNAVNMGKAFLEEKTGDTNQLSASYPLFEYVLNSARGVIAHNPQIISKLQTFCKAPIMYAPLPYKCKADICDPVDRRERKRQVYKIVIFGYLGSSNRRLRPFLEAFAKSGCADAFEITLAGKYSDSDLKTWIKPLGISFRIKRLGFLSDDDLDELLRDSDLCINLRWPSRGEASGTLLRTWDQSLPVLVTHTDFYSTLPKDIVAFVDPEKETEDIIHHLKAFAQNPNPYFELGLNARKHLYEEHSADVFTEHLRNFIPVVHESRGQSYPQIFGQTLTQQFLVDYPDPAARESLLKSCAKEVSLWTNSI
jgi:glycosyltransferase involved in cell wall biosynthesis